MTILLCAWLAWVAWNVALILLVPRIAKSKAGAFTNGVHVVVAPVVAELLTPAELAAVVAHERGHVAHRHAWKNLALACLLIPRWQQLRVRQEIEADDYAALAADPGALASALRKLSAHPFDMARARRLDAIAAGRAPA